MHKLDVESLTVTSFETSSAQAFLESTETNTGCPPTVPRCSIPWSGCANCGPDTSQ